MPSPEPTAAPEPAAEPTAAGTGVAVTDLAARAEAAARAAAAVERGICPQSEAASRYQVTPEELAEASRALQNMPQIKKKLTTLGMRRAVAGVLRGHSQQWAVSNYRVSCMCVGDGGGSSGL